MVTRKVDWYTDQCNLSCRVELSLFAVSLKYILLVRSLRRGNAINAEHFNTRGFYSTEKKNSLQIHTIQQCYNTLYACSILPQVHELHPTHSVSPTVSIVCCIGNACAFISLYFSHLHIR